MLSADFVFDVFISLTVEEETAVSDDSAAATAPNMAIIASTTHPDIIVDMASGIPDVTNAVATIHPTEELDPANECAIR